MARLYPAIEVSLTTNQLPRRLAVPCHRQPTQRRYGCLGYYAPASQSHVGGGQTPGPTYLGTPLTLTEGPKPAEFTALTFTVIRTPFLPLTDTDVAVVDFQTCLPT